MNRLAQRTPWYLATFAFLAYLPAQVTLVEPGHVLVKHMDSMAPANPSQTLFETTMPLGDIESICVDPRSGDVFVQLMHPAGAPVSQTTHIFRFTPATGIVTPVAINTGFGISERGTDMQFDPSGQFLVTQDQNSGIAGQAERIASINPVTGMLGTWSFVTTPPIFVGGTFGADFSQGNGGSIVPPGDLVFTSDGMANGIHSARFFGAASMTHVPSASLPLGAGDDMIILPNGDWVWVGDGAPPITLFKPFPPHAAMPSTLSLQTMFTSAGLQFIAGSRAAVCDVSGAIYVSFSAATGGTGIFRVDSTLMTAKLILTVGRGQGSYGLHDLEIGPSSTMACNSLFFTVHDYITGGEQIWEVTATACCPPPASTGIVPDRLALNAPQSITPWPVGNLPTLGNTGFSVQLNDPGNACVITPGSSSFLLLAFSPGSVMLPVNFGCAPGTPGEVQLSLPAITASGPVPWPGPVAGAVHALPIPFDSSICGLPVYLQGVWLDLIGPTSPTVLSWRLDLNLGH